MRYTKWHLWLAMMLCVLTLCGCQESVSLYADTVFTGMDTAITLRLPADTDKTLLHDATTSVEKLVAELEKSLSCHDTESELYALNQAPQRYHTTDTTLGSVLHTALSMASLTDGAYDPTMGQLTDLWNVAHGGPKPKDAAIADAMTHCGWERVTIEQTISPTANTSAAASWIVTKEDPLLQLDLGGIGKGYGLQSAVTLLADMGIDYGLVSFGGNIGVFGEKPDGTPFQIGVKDPHDTSSIVGYLYIQNGFVSVSGDYERFFRQDGVIYHHILDPDTGYPADNGLSSVVVYATNGAAADALSTALFVLGIEDGMALYRSAAASTLSFEALFITADDRIIATPGMEKLFDKTAKAYTLSVQE